MTKRTKSILEMTSGEAKQFLLKGSSYFSLSLPPYFSFKKMIKDIDVTLGRKELKSFLAAPKKTKISDFDGVNYDLYNNKDGKYSWRKLQIIHPAIYVDLVNKITKSTNWTTIINRFKDFQKDSRIKCISIPKESNTSKTDVAETILDWWEQIEQESLKKSLEYKLMMATDINDCYGAIYTHSIAWALHTKAIAKRKRTDPTLIGNTIDTAIQSMQNGQTNGIPQGSVLMDFIAEMVLSYADELLSEELKKNKIKDYFILRYRDDYRIFANDSKTLGRVAKHLSDVLINLNFRMNSSKTFTSADIIKSSIKPDKLEWNKSKQFVESELIDNGITMHQKQLLLIHSFSAEYPNSGTLTKALAKYYKTIIDFENTPADVLQSIAIVLDIAVNNPKCFSLAFAIIGKLLSLLKEKDVAVTIAKRIFAKVKELPNSNYAEVWLYRALLKVIPKKINKLKTSKELHNYTSKIWNSTWVDSTSPLFVVLQNSRIVDKTLLKSIDKIIKTEEVSPFEYDG